MQAIPLVAARSVPCPRCGGIFGLQTLAAHVDCPFCAHRFALSHHKLAELAHYQQRVHAVLGEANVEYRQAAQWEWTEQATTRGGSWVVFAVFFGTVIVGGVVLQVVVSSGFVRGDAMMFLSYGFLAFVMGSTVLTSLWLTGKKRSAQRVGAGVTRVACPSCGAPNELHAGQTLETCRYCRAALVPSAGAMQRALSQVQEAGRAAELARFRAERKGMAALMGRSVGRYYHYIVVGSFLPMTLGTALIWLVSAVFDPTSANLRAAVALWLLGGINASILLAFYVRESSIRGRWRRVADDLAYQFRGQRIASGLRGVVEWLNAYWAAPYDVGYLSSSLYHTSLALDACGYPALVDIDPGSIGARRYPARLHVLIAAAVPEPIIARQIAIPHASHAAWAWLTAAGFELRPTRSGLLAIAQPLTIEKLRRVPTTAHMLSTVITTLAGLARALGAVPVSPVP